ncbi:MAG TPA: magnesium chelatase domain-containing protein, partial [Actinomycetota bacterium]|nr:magnesium chelatase domain-containing protein [Actinomycetota bacterium]
MYGRVIGVTIAGVRGRVVWVEAHVGRGLPALVLTGLPGAAVTDSRDRVRASVENAGLAWPLRRVVVNLSPAGVRKDGPGMDLAIALGVLAASSQVPRDRLERYAFYGELSLRGELVPTPGALPAAIAAARAGLDGIVVPRANAPEAALVEGLAVVGAERLAQVAGFLRGSWTPPPARAGEATPAHPHPVDLAEVRGQARARRALEVA